MKFKHAVVITGSIGSGKSAVCELLAGRGFETIDADQISHCVLDHCTAQVAEIFGAQYVVQKDAQAKNLSSHAESNANSVEEILSASRASVDRKKLGELVFKNPAELAKLEALLHPKIAAEILSQAQALEAKEKIYFVDIPLFFEGKRYEFFDKVAVVYAPKDTLISRVMKRNGLDHAAAKHRVELQMDIEQKRAMADFVIDNGGDLAALKTAVERFLKELKDKI
ncbi:dephospho-CoA kinase [Campylobacter gracilis]|uniref:Dephospho-CoA kinase n=1 Tax=Campylobacter gracilis RM3268 TaxID=553220 RepID=C8PDV5_9BACT|nr:dephospho-CoA kinase [Campylobacter gracilis]AKT91630.1 dephospho-CoA kinase [Campylobacter gracilis]EEV19027.1 dephospho-CoA kinase [Campylobacter gracilis RM3268]UEB46161.1 dephospho-CoA kinase [Campylobacter gracilis]SUW77920.1 dephospho-CoA kinase [Campylobacter gracilis]